MVEATYSLGLDSNGDGTYDTDLSAYLRTEGLEWSLGVKDPEDNMARESTLQCELLNSTNLFSPSHGSALAGFTIGAALRLQMTYGGSTVTKFTGRIETDGIEPLMGIYGERITKVRASSYWYILQRQEAHIAVSQDISTGAVIALLLQNMNVFPPIVKWALGIPQYSNVGVSTILSGGISDFSDLDTGVYIFNYIGDNFSAGATVYEVLRDIVETEDGLLFMDADGKIVFIGNDHWYTAQASAAAATLVGTDIIDGADQFGRNLINRVVLTFYPREVGTPLTRIGAFEEVQVFDPYIAGGADDANAKTIIIPYTNQTTGDEIGGLNVVTPVAGVDWTAHPAWDSSINISNYFVLTAEDQGNQMTLTFYHTYPALAYIASVYVRGTPLTDLKRATITVEDIDSQDNYNLAEKSYRMKLMDNQAYAENWALSKLHQNSIPNDVIESLTLYGNKSATHMGYCRDLAIGDRIVVSEGQTGINADSYFVVGQQHSVENKLHSVQLILRPAPPVVWVLGEEDFSEIGETTYLGLGVI